MVQARAVTVEGDMQCAMAGTGPVDHPKITIGDAQDRAHVPGFTSCYGS